MLRMAFGHKAVNRTKVFEWDSRLKFIHLKMARVQRDQTPAKQMKMRNKLENIQDDRRLTIQKIAEKVGIDETDENNPSFGVMGTGLLITPMHQPTPPERQLRFLLITT